ncbi:hypothetical protein [Rubrivirga sp.]|uniref:hypothetical protein n=1 Tax=Rubrivirga sp. TaxID=1885344 RepID=UPI003C75EB41
MSDAISFHAVSLVATARTALQAAQKIGDRRAGRDASEQQPADDVWFDLEVLLRELQTHVARLRLRAAVGVEDVASAVQSFEDRLLIDDFARVLDVMHQKLLSLYPAVDEDLVEDVRRFGVAAHARALEDDAADGSTEFAIEAARLSDRLAELG